MAEIKDVMVLESIQVDGETYLKPLKIASGEIKDGKVIIENEAISLLDSWNQVGDVAVIKNSSNGLLFDYFIDNVEKYYKVVADNFLVMLSEEEAKRIKELFSFSIPTKSLAEQFIEYCKNGEQRQPFKLNSLVKNEAEQRKPVNFNIGDIYEYAQKYIVGQDEQLKTFIANLYINYQLNKREVPKNKLVDLRKTILITGFSGVGKTLMMKTVAQALHIPYVIEDITRYSKTAYVGQDIDAMFENLYHAAGDDREEAEKGIIFIDEFDKCCNNDEEHGKVTTVALQEALLKKIEGVTFNLEMGSPLNREHISFDTSRITFVLAGSFANLSRQNVIIDDETLMRAGLIPELAGRISTTIKLNTPDKEDLKAFIQLPDGYFQSYLAFLRELDVQVEYDDEFIDYIAEKAIELDLGYRGVKKVLESLMADNLYDSLTGNISILKLKK